MSVCAPDAVTMSSIEPLVTVMASAVGTGVSKAFSYHHHKPSAIWGGQIFGVGDSISGKADAVFS